MKRQFRVYPGKRVRGYVAPGLKLPDKLLGVLGGGGKKHLFGDGTYSQNVLQAMNVTSGTLQNTRHYDLATGSLIIEKSVVIPAGAVVDAIQVYENYGFTNSEFYIMRRNSAGSYTCVKKLLGNTTAAYAYQQFALESPYTIPDDGCTYHVGVRYPGDAPHANLDTAKVWAYKAGTTTEGSTDSYTEAVGATYGTLLIGWVGKTLVQPVSGVLTITGTATGAPDAGTGTSVLVCDTLTLDGASASLSPSTNCKGLIIFAKTKIELKNGAKLNIDKLGKAGNFGNLTVLDLVPQSIKRKLKPTLANYVVLGEGAAGAPTNAVSSGSASGGAGSTASAMQTGGGGAGGVASNTAASAGAGGKGGPCCGGAGSGAYVGEAVGSSSAASPYGGPGSAGVWASTIRGVGGGAGDPVGASTNITSPATGAGGGLLMLFTPSLVISPGCIVSADGGQGGQGSTTSGSTDPGAGGSAGGGCVVIVTLTGGYSNAGTVRANGGAATVATALPTRGGGAGGAGSVNILTVS